MNYKIGCRGAFPVHAVGDCPNLSNEFVLVLASFD